MQTEKSSIDLRPYLKLKFMLPKGMLSLIEPGITVTVKILYVVNSAEFLLSHRRNLLKVSQQQGYEIHVAAPFNSEAVNEFKRLNCKYHVWSVSRKGTNFFNELISFFRLCRLYKRIRPALVHHLTIKPIIYGSLAARITRIGAVVNAVSGLGHVFISTDYKARCLRKLAALGYRYAANYAKSRFIFQNEQDQAELALSAGVQPEKSSIIPGSGVCMQKFKPLPLPASGKITVVLGGRMIKEKGVLEFVEAAKHLSSEKHIKFVLVGQVDPGNPSSLSHSEINAWVAEGLVEWWGYQKDMREVFSRSHIVCLPSYREGSPRVLIEAAACARALITTDVPGCRDLVDGMTNGRLVSAKSSVELARAIHLLSLAPAALAVMGVASRHLVEKNFSEERVFSETLILYSKMLENGSVKCKRFADETIKKI